MGSGVALFDADGDGWLDILLVNSRDWQPGKRKSLPALYRNNHNGTFTDVTAGERPRRRDLRPGSGRRRLRQRRPRGRLHHRARRRPPLPQRGERQVQGRHRGGGDQERQLRRQRRLARLRPRRQGRPLRGELRPVEQGEGPLVLARRRHQVLLHPRVLQGGGAEALPQSGRRQIRGREPEGGDRRSQQQVARRHRARLQRRRLAGPLRGQRHAAQQALPQPEERHLRGRGGGGGGRLLGRGDGARRHGRRRRGLRPLRPSAPAGGQLHQRDARPLSQRGERRVRGRGAPPRRWDRRAC